MTLVHSQLLHLLGARLHVPLFLVKLAAHLLPRGPCWFRMDLQQVGAVARSTSG